VAGRARRLGKDQGYRWIRIGLEKETAVERKSWIRLSVGLLAVVALAGLFFARASFNRPERSMYQEDFADGKDPAAMLGGHLLLGKDDGWSGTVSQGRYVLENRGDPRAIRYCYLIPKEVNCFTEGARAMVAVALDSPGKEELSGAGLLFGFDPRTQHYIGLILTGRQGYAVLQRDAEGARISMSGTHDAIRTEGFNRLEILVDESMLILRANGYDIGSIGRGAVTGEGVGLLAVGSGRFQFDALHLEGAGRDYSEIEAQRDFLVRDDDTPADSAFLQPPPGYSRVRHGADSGELWLCDEVGKRSSRQALMDAVERLEPAFGERPILAAVIGDDQDRETRALFRVHTVAGEKRGLLVAVRKDDAMVAACLFDAPANLSVSFPSMIRTIARHLPASVPANQPASRPVDWRQVPLPDGSGSMMLPTDWRIAAASQGMVDALGIDGSHVALGIHGPVLTPEMGAAYQQMPGATVPVPVAPYSDPVTALQNLFPQFGLQSPQRILRIHDSAPTPWPHGGQAAFVHFDWQQGTGAQAREFTSLALFGVMPGYNQWTFYLSIVSAPTQVFARNLPMLMEIWNNWKVADHVHRQRLDKAASDMREIGAIIEQTHDRRQQAQDRMAADWTEVLRDQTFLGDTQLGERHEVPLTQVQDWASELNRLAGYERFRHIPLRDLR
jgi:hypothetical protein